MAKIKIGLLKETKTPPDRRAALTPHTAKMLKDNFNNVEVYIQPSTLRAFSDDEYTALGLPLKEDLSDCDILLGVKEVKIDTLIADKTYMFFAHVAKKQEHNKPLLKAMMEKSITMIDYEYLTEQNGRRLVAFGYWAGIVGAYNGMRAWMKRFEGIDLTPAHQFHDKKEMFQYISTIQINKPFKIVITGGGRVGLGATETLKAFGIQEVFPEDFLLEQYDYPVFTRLDPCHYVRHKDGKEFDLWHFFKNPDQYVSTFKAYTKVADLYIAAHFWDPRSPKFFTANDTKRNDFNIKVVADISCDLDGPVGSTLRASTIEEPFYDFDPLTGTEKPAFSSEHHITVMAVDNLPGELPRDASEAFSQILVEKIFPYLLYDDSEGVIERATILKNGQLTERFKYLQDWIND